MPKVFIIRLPRFLLYTAMAMFLTFVFPCAGAFAASELKVDLWPEKHSGFDFETDDVRKSLFLMVSMTPVDKANFLVADYDNIFLLNVKDKTFRMLRLGGDLKGFKFVPKGLYFSKAQNLLYVGNYTANNVLVFLVDMKTITLKLVREIKTEKTISPAHVFVSDDGKHLVVSNEDGVNVSAFDISGYAPVESWSAKVAQPHGICIVKDRVYVTSLTDRTLIELNLVDGKILRTMGRLGWNPDDAGLLWPTSVYPFSDTELIMTDAHTGLVYIVDRESLKITKYFGGNGPTFKYLHMPYSAIVVGDEFFIISTFQKRILIGDKKTFRIKESISENKDDWAYLKDNLRNMDLKKIGQGWKDYVWEEGPLLNIGGARYLPGYGHLHPKPDASAYPVFNLDSLDTLFDSETYFYFLNAAQTQDGMIMFSPETPRANALTVKDGVTYFYPIKWEIDNWNIGNGIYGRMGKKDIRKIIDEAKEAVKELDASRRPNGLLSKDSLYGKMFSKYLDARKIYFDKYFLNTFESANAKIFLEQYNRCLSYGCSAGKVRDITKKYYMRVRGEAYVEFDEFLLIQMLGGYFDEFFFRGADTLYNYYVCESAAYYQGYGPEILKTASVDDYLSAFDINRSSVCMKTVDGRTVLPSEISMIWYSPELYGEDFTLTGQRVNNGKVEYERRLLNVKGNEPKIVNGFAVNDFVVYPGEVLSDDGKGFNNFIFKLSKGHKDNRLIIRKLTVHP